MMTEYTEKATISSNGTVGFDLRSIYKLFLYLGFILATTTELLENFIDVNVFFISPMRIYIILLMYILIIHWLYVEKLRIVLHENFKKYLGLVTLFLSWVFLSIIVSPDTVYSLKRSLNMFFLFFLSILTYQLFKVIKPDIKMLMRLWFIISIALSLIGLLQELLNLPVVRDFESRDILGVTIVRINSLFKDPNFFGYFLLSSFFLAVFYPYKVSMVFVKPLIIIFFTIIIFLTGSRGTILALLITLLFKVFRIQLNRWWKILSIGTIIVFLFVVNLILSNPNLMIETIYKYDDEKSLSGISRLIIWVSGLNLIKNSPIFGVGPGNFVKSGKGEFIEFLTAEQKEKISGMAGHSNYLEIAAESGLLALFLFVLIIFYVLKLLHKKIQQQTIKAVEKRTVMWLFYCIISMMISNFFLSYYPFFLFILIGLALYISEGKRWQA